MRLDSKNESLEVLVKSAATFRTASSFNRLGDRFLELKNFEQAVQWKELAANSGNVDAQYFIGLCLREGYYGVEKDLTESFNYFKMAAEKGHQEAQKELSVAFNNGIGTAIDKKNGKKWQNAAKDRLPTQTKFRPTLDFGRNMDSLPELSQFAEFQRDLSCQYLKKIDHPIYNIDDLKTQIFQFKDNLHLQCVDINHPEHELMLYICRSLIKFKDFVHETDYKGAIGELAKVFKSYTGIFSLKNFGLKLMAQTCVVAVLMTHAPEFLDQTKNCVVPDASLMKASDPTTNPFVLDKFMANKPNRNINKDLIQDALLVDLFINVSSRPIDLSLIHLDFLFKEYPGNLHATLLRAKLLMATGNSGTALLDFNACALYCNEPANDKFWETDILGKQVYLYKIELLFSRGSLYTLCKKYNIAIVDLDMCIQMSRAYSFSRRIVDAAFIAASCYLFIEDLSKFKTYYEMGVKERTIRAYKEESIVF